MGTPCVGKTSACSRLAKELDAVHIDLGELVIEEKLSSGFDETRGTFIADRTKLVKRVRERVMQDGKKQDIIVDGHFATDVVRPEDVTRVFVLRRHPKELQRLMEKRGFEGRKLWENLAAEVLDVCLYDAIQAVGANKVCEIDVSGRRVEEVVRGIVLVLNGKRPCTVGIVDWLGKLEQEGELDQYLREF
jgi:adenylate kinase